MKKLRVILFQAGICDSCDISWSIVQSLAGIINGSLEENVIALEHYTLGDEEGQKKALEMGVHAGPTIIINGEKHEGRVTGQETFEAFLSKLDIDEKRKESIRRSFLGPKESP